ncbi:MAG: hypothetical protein KKD00_03035, partial [Gammaproteobacteria bacterium]|nr:hypothetical protein [Gammaproteobacteria bacterium]
MAPLLSVPTLTLVLIVALAALAGAFVSWLICHRALLRKTSDHQVLREQLIQAQTQLLQERRHSEDKLRALQADREDLKQQFQLLATDVLDEKSRRLTENNQLGLNTILQPLQEKISSFEKKVEETYNREARERFSLEKELRSLQA